jgi:hypothetical protein
MKTALLLALLAASAAGAERLPPVDESASDASFEAFKAQLQGALQRKDVRGLLNAVDPQVRVSFGDDNGISAFRRQWRLERPNQSPIWEELGTVLRLGVTRDENEFIAPYVFTRFPQTLDAFTHAAVVKPQATLRASAAETSPKVAVLDYDVVELLGARRRGWVEVRTLGGKQGWVQEGDIRSPINYRAFFEKKGGQWKLTAFLIGD